ncbi:cytochrome c oxidase subunit 3 [Methylorubrum populi]|uniref:Cytochrome c oxidase subunit 3 n=1 Tax=Methylorubrum rhodesianum TaxID=29427 RepID=A0ABU9Z417_9HYPH|nr:cytochrome c oxidase subunit 3 [Methylorubrum rhodesianum]MBK3403722.1 cytochrome c oxidase subunit 3 [Methylorubrum rhodesianum]MBY0141825.1 cytochrome c oxidase subunit 3 [Methylorubrum populi]
MSAGGDLIEKTAERHLREPWDELGLAGDRAFAYQRAGATFGIWIFIASEVLFFGALFLLYTAMRLEHAADFAIAARETNIVYGTLNTALLLTSGLCAAIASQASEQKGLQRLTLWCLGATVLLGLAFMAVKGVEYSEDIEKHLLPGAGFALKEPATQLFFGFYWLATSIHAIHLSIGIALVVRLIWKEWREPGFLFESPQVEVAMLYWGFVDMIWIVLYPMLYLDGRAG